jgi:hypothetical protein
MRIVAIKTEALYHGTTAEAGRKIQAEGWLKPRGSAPSSYETGTFGGMPSNPKFCYVTKDREMALHVMKDVCLKKGTKAGALVTVRSEGTAGLDEDDAYEMMYNILQRGGYSLSPWENAVLKLYARQHSMRLDAALQHFDALNQDVANGDSPAESMAEEMKVLAEGIMEKLPEWLPIILNFTSCRVFSNPLPVVKVEFLAA